MAARSSIDVELSEGDVLKRLSGSAPAFCREGVADNGEEAGFSCSAEAVFSAEAGFSCSE